MSPSLTSAAAILARHPLFQCFAFNQLELLCTLGQTVRVGLGDRIAGRGHSGGYLAVILRGRLRLSRSRLTGQRVTLGFGRVGDVIGLELLTPPGTYSSSYTVAEDGQILRLPVDALLDLIQRSPPVVQRLYGLLALHRLQWHLRDDSFLGPHGLQEFATQRRTLRPYQASAGSPLTKVGLIGDGWFVLSKGTVERTGGGAGSGELRPGDSFGGESLLDWPSQCDHAAATPIECWFLSRDEFERDSPPLGPPSAVRSVIPYPVWVGQHGAADCGAAALAMVARQLGVAITIEDVRRHLVIGHNGVSLDDLTRVADRLGLKPRGLHAGGDVWSSIPLPAIALLRDQHYVVIHRIDGESVLLGDPALGIVSWSRESFQQRWSGHLLVLEPEFPPKSN